METSTGWVKLHRQFLEWEWFDEPNTCRLFLYCLLKANHQDKKYRGETIKRGTFITSLEVLSNDTKISVRSVRTSLKRLESTGEVTSQRTPKGTVIQIVKYNDYQVVTSETTSERQTSDKQVTTTKNDKKEKKYREFAHLSLSQVDFEKLNKVYTKEQIDKTLNNIENFRNNKKYKSLYLTALNWLDRDYPQDDKDDYVANVLKQIK